MIRTALLLLAVLLSLGSFASAQEAQEIIFAVRQPGPGHWYENFGYLCQDETKKLYKAMGRLCRLNLRTGQLTVIFEDLQGAVRDPAVHYDGKKILFSYRKGGSDYFHLYEINADGTNLRQLTDGPYDDLEPIYLPDGRLMFCSSRCNQWVPCWFSQVAVIYSCDGDGKNIRRVSGNIEHDNTPWMLSDGRVIYERWEYVDRSRVSFHHLWAMNPDGTGQMIWFGNMHPGTLMIDAKPIPGSDKVVCVFSPGHGKAEHAGAIAIVTPQAGPDELAAAKEITRGKDWRDPYPLSEDSFLVAQGAGLFLMNQAGEAREVYRLPAELVKAGAECHEPRLLAARPREPIIPPRIAPAQDTARLILSDIYTGRRMEGVARGQIKKLLVLESLPKPINESGKMPPISWGGTYTLERVLGTVPVEPDGSAYMEVPALRSLFFVALDENNNSVKRMMSFLSLMPGETTGCVGCHEYRNQAPRIADSASLQALRRPPSAIEPLANIPDVFDFPRDIQPILDKHCVSCHDYDRRDGNVILTGDRGPVYSHSYYTLTALGYVSDGRDRVVTNLPPRSIGTSASSLMKLIDGSHYNARLTAHEQDMIRYWIESAAPYPGTYAALGTGMIGGYPRSQLDTSDRKWPASVAASEAIRRRCAACHDKSRPMPQGLSDDMGLVLQNPRADDPRVRWSRHLMFNLSRPEKSLILLAPLAKEAGGYALCTPKPVFTSPADPDFQAILTLCRQGKSHLAQIKRFDMPDFRPPPMYVREMKRFGILAHDTPPDAPLNVYALDQAYWRSLWWQAQPPNQ